MLADISHFHIPDNATFIFGRMICADGGMTFV